MTPEEILAQAKRYQGKTINEVSGELGTSIPEDHVHTKGKVGNLFEVLPGSDAKSHSSPDFEKIGLELKVVPINEKGKPWETTAITSIDYMEIPSQKWEDSRAYRKTRHILFVPIIQMSKKASIGERRVGKPFLWRPSPQVDSQLKKDWESAAYLIREGRAHELTGRMGLYMQPRTKGRNSTDLVEAPGIDNQIVRVKRRAFYFRVSFTRRIIEENLEAGSSLQ